MPHQVGLTLVARVPAKSRAALAGVLDELAEDPGGNAVLPFGYLPAVHFGRALLVDARGSTRLVVTLDCDAPEERVVRAVAALPGVDRLLGQLEGWPTDGSRDGRVAWLEAHLQRSDVVYVHSVGRSLPQVRAEARLRAALETWCDGHPELVSLPSAGVRDALLAHVAGDPDLAWALEPAAPVEPGFGLRETAHAVAVPLLLLLASPLLLPALAVWALVLRRHERREEFVHVEPDPERLRGLADTEDVSVQNAFTSLAPIRPGRFWRLTSRLTLLVGDYTARHVFTRGSLSGLTTVHFARFLRLGPEGDLLFTSYYDGSLESYNNDFVDQVAWVLNTVFGQQAGYPRTRWMVLEGAHDERWFKDFIRGHQVATPVWWSAYPDLAAVTVDQNARLRAGLSEQLDDEGVRAWLRLL